MGTKADFYVGRGADAEWIGSVTDTGTPEALTPFLDGVTDRPQFRRAVARIIDAWGPAGIRPQQGWPWPWPTSHLTDYAYAFDRGRVHATGACSQWFDPLDVPAQDDGFWAQPELPDDAFPRMRGGAVRRPPSLEALKRRHHPGR
jgi:hypothetical protein